MKNLYVIKEEKEVLLLENVELLDAGIIEEKQFGQLAPIASQQTYLLFTDKQLEVDAGEKYYVLDGEFKIWIEPLEWLSHKSKDYKDNQLNAYFIKVLKSINQTQ